MEADECLLTVIQTDRKASSNEEKSSATRQRKNTASDDLRMPPAVRRRMHRGASNNRRTAGGGGGDLLPACRFPYRHCESGTRLRRIPRGVLSRSSVLLFVKTCEPARSRFARFSASPLCCRTFHLRCPLGRARSERGRSAAFPLCWHTSPARRRLAVASKSADHASESCCQTSSELVLFYGVHTLETWENLGTLETWGTLMTIEI